MIILGLFGIVALGGFCWLLFTLAVYVLPFFVGLTAGFAAYHTGAGLLGGFIVGALAGAAALVIGQVALASVRSPLLRMAIASAYALPAAFAGYNATLGLARLAVPALGWQVAFAVVGALAVGGTAWTRMFLFVDREIPRGVAEGPAHSPS